MIPEGREQSGTGIAAVHEISCSRCGAVIKPGKKFCSQCGCPAVAVPTAPPAKRLRHPTICPECSFENHHSDLFCKGCGAQLADSPVGLASSDSVSENRVASPAEGLVKTELSVPTVTSREPTDLGTDIPVPQTMQAASAPPLEEQNEMVQADAAGSAFPSDQSPDLARLDLERAGLESEVPSPLLVTGQASSQESGDESPAVKSSAGSEAAKPRRPSPRAVGVAVGVGLAVLVPLVHFHRPAKAQAKPSSVATTAIVARGPSPSRADPVAPTESANQHFGLASLSSAVDHGQSPGDLVRPSRALSRKSLEDALPPNSKRADVHQVTATGSAAALTTGYDHQPAVPAVPAPSRPAPISDQSQIQNSAPPVSGSPQAPAPLAEVSRQIPAALPSSLPANLRAEIKPGPVSTQGPAASANATETVQTVQPAKLLSHPALRYPALALKSGIEGDVHLEASVRPDGTVGSVKVVYGNSILSDAAVELVQNSRYQPATVDGRPVRSNVDVVISFHLPR